jgi:hypothetical protein
VEIKIEPAIPTLLLKSVKDPRTLTPPATSKLVVALLVFTPTFPVISSTVVFSVYEVTPTLRFFWRLLRYFAIVKY